jgi:hypothetical protein
MQQLREDGTKLCSRQRLADAAASTAPERKVRGVRRHARREAFRAERVR